MNRVACALLFLLALFGLAGCSSTIKVGAVISESGAADVYAEPLKTGMELAREEINAAGGIEGKTLEFIYADDETKEDVGKQVVEKLIKEDGVRLIIGATSSKVTLKIAPICQREKVVLLSPSASAPSITDSGSYIFRNYPSDILEGNSIALFARDLGLERIVVFAVDNEFGNGLKEIFVEKYPSKFRQILKVYEFEENDTSQFAAWARETDALDPDGIYIAAYVTDVADLIIQLREAGSKAVIMGNSSVTEQVVQLAGKAVERFIYPQPGFDLNTKDAAMSAFITAYRNKYGSDPDRFAAHGYDSVKLLAKAIEEGGSAYPKDVKVGLVGISNYPGASGQITFDQNGDVVQYPRPFIIWEGEALPYDRFVDEGGTLPIPGRS